MPPRRQTRADPLRVLIAEDDPAVRDLVRARLSSAGYAVAAVNDGQSALSMMMGARPDILILDLNMPEMDGFRVLEAMQGYGVRDVLVMVLTARHAATDVRRVLDLGAQDYLAKPFTSSQLLARVGRLAGMLAARTAAAV